MKKNYKRESFLKLSPRGQGLIMAIDEGLVEKTEDGHYDDSLFHRLWDIFERVYRLREVKSMEPEMLKMISLALSAFSVGFASANTIWVFFSPSSKRRKERKREAGNADKKGKD